MCFEIVGREGALAGQRFPVGETPVTFGRHAENGVVITSRMASRFHAEVVREGEGYVLYDRGSRNGTYVNGGPRVSHSLRPGDRIAIGEETFVFEGPDAVETVTGFPLARREDTPDEAATPPPVLRVRVAGGGPVGLAFALLLEHRMGPRVSITVHDSRWVEQGGRVVWKDERQGNVRRQQVVTIQSRQFRNLPPAVQERVFAPGRYTEMWPPGPDSVEGYGPRNVRIAHVEDVLLDMANERPDRIRLTPGRFDPVAQHEDVAADHVLAICEGARSSTGRHFSADFGQPDSSIYSLDGHHLEDMVLGLRVKSDLSDPTTVLLTVAQNRFLLNALEGEGFLNMRLTDEEAQEVVGIDPVRREFESCVASRPCVMTRNDHDDFHCSTHRTLFLPALVKGSKLWRRVHEGLALFGVAPENLTAVTAFRLSMVQRPRFTAQLFPATSATPGTFGFLLGDAANSIHFWPGRGLNSGLASAVSLARSLERNWTGRPFRDADFTRHEAAMSMLQYRHKSRAWKAMITTDGRGGRRAIKDAIAEAITQAQKGGAVDADTDLDALLTRLRQIRDRLGQRLPGMPDDTALLGHLRRISGETLRSLVASGPWDTQAVGGEEVDIDLFYQEEPATPSPARALSG